MSSTCILLFNCHSLFYFLNCHSLFYILNCHSLFYILNCHSLFYYLNCHFSILLSLLSFSFFKYVHREFLHKGAVSPAFAPTYFDTYLVPDAEDFMFTKLQVERFPLPHLKAGEWYFDCVGRFVPSTEDNLHHALAKSAPISIVEDKVESSLPVEVEKEKAQKGKKGKKDKGKATAGEAPSIANVATRSTIKAGAKAYDAPNVTRVGSPSMGPPVLVEPPSQSEAPVLQLPSEVQKRKAIALDALSPPRASSLSSLIENTDMEALILAYMHTIAHNAIYTGIQNFFGHMSFSCPQNSFIFK